jgi:hypothetical protein
MKTKIALFSTFLFLFAIHASSSVAAGKNGCLLCHTSDATLKLLFKPPVMGPSEGEG